MREMNAGPSRRSFLTRIGAGGLGALAAAPAVAQQTSKSFWSQEYSAQKGAVKLYMYRKRLEAPARGERPLPVLFLVHGSSLSGRPTFDLKVPGRGDYSLMETFAAMALTSGRWISRDMADRRARKETRTSLKASGT